MQAIILNSGEEVVLQFRRSIAVLAGPLVLTFVLIVLPVWYVNHYALSGYVGTFLFWWCVLVVAWFVRRFFLWHRERYIVTTHRFVKTGHDSVFRQTVSETALDRMLNISLRTTGVWSVLAGFGDIDLQVVGRLEPIIIRSVQRPGVVKEFLWRLHEKTGKTAGGSAGEEYVKPNQPI